MNAKQSSRRRFLTSSAAMAGLARGALRSASAQTSGSETREAHPKDTRAYGERSRFENAVRMPLGRALTPLQDLVGILTPNSLHCTISHGSAPPDIDPQQHRLLIHGMVERPLVFTLAELKRLPSVSRIHFIECDSNSSPNEQRNPVTAQQAHGATSCSEWTGVLLSLLLQEAGVQKGASWLIAEGAETRSHSMSLPLAKAMDDILVAYGQNGEAVRPEQGYPLRLVIPGWHGIVNIKWLRRIKVVDEPYMSRFEATGYPSLRADGKSRWLLFEMPPKSVITFPSGGQQLPGAGFYEITGLAWSGGGAVRRVEVSTDGGRTWKDAELQEPVLRFAHTRFRFPWTWNGEEAVLQSRSTDELGQVQPTLAELSKIWGVTLDYWGATTNHVDHFNPIQPWKVTREGRVENVLLS